MRINYAFANTQEATIGYLLTHAQKFSKKCPVAVQDNRKFGVRRESRVCGAHFSSIKGTLILCFTNRHRQISISVVTCELEYIVPYHFTRTLPKTFTIFKECIKLMKGKALRKQSLHEKTAASVLLKLFISGNE